jgi:hypothetical protein
MTQDIGHIIINAHPMNYKYNVSHAQIALYAPLWLHFEKIINNKINVRLAQQ